MTKRKSNDPLDAAAAALAAAASGPEDLMAQLRELKRRTLQSMLDAEMEEHLGYEKHSPKGYNSGNSRNGTSKKTVLTEDSALEVRVPRDRNGTFEPKVVEKGQRRLKGFDDKVIALYARGLSTRDIRAHVEEIYGVDIAPSLVSRITDQVLADVQAWQTRRLERVYPIVYFDALRVKIRHEGQVRNMAVYVVLAIDVAGHKQVLGLWIAENEGAKFWMRVMTELSNRGVEDILFACVDGLKGFPEAVEAVFPQTTVQTCVVHMIRQSTHMVAWKNRRAVIADLKPIYRAPSEAAALQALDSFEATWGDTYPSIGESWRRNWARIAPLFGYSEPVRRAIYTTNPIEGVHRQLRKVLKTRGLFPTTDSVVKVLYLNIARLSAKWTHPRREWDQVIQQLAIQFDGRVQPSEYAAR